MKISKTFATALCAAVLPATMWANDYNRGGGSSDNCSSLPNNSRLRTALMTAVSAEGTGLNFPMWATIVDRDGVVCAVAFSGYDRGDQWPGSRVISAQKANTGNAFSLDRLALSTANLYSAVQPGGSLFGLQESNPVDTGVAYGGPSSNFGKQNDPMVGDKIGGINVFGGGLGLYRVGRKIVGGLGVSGDTSCEDHRVAWRVRHILNLDYVPAGVSGDSQRPDNMVFDIQSTGNIQTNGKSLGGWGHPHCLSQTDPAIDGVPNTLPAIQ